MARDLFLNKLRYRQLQPYRHVKRVETETVITHWPYGRDNGKTRIHSNMVLPQGQDREKHAWPYSVDKCKISTLLTGVIPYTFVARYGR